MKQRFEEKGGLSELSCVVLQDLWDSVPRRTMCEREERYYFGWRTNPAEVHSVESRASKSSPFAGPSTENRGRKAPLYSIQGNRLPTACDAGAEGWGCENVCAVVYMTSTVTCAWRPRDVSVFDLSRVKGPNAEGSQLSGVIRAIPRIITTTRQSCTSKLLEVADFTAPRPKRFPKGG